MGYSTEFAGSFKLNKPLAQEHLDYLKNFSRTRRMKRNVEIAKQLPDPVRHAAGLSVGHDGAFFVGAKGFCGQDEDSSILDYNSPPHGQPGLWCQWEPNEDGTEILWNGAEKFYYYVEWLHYLIDNFIGPWGYVLNGEVTWQGEETRDVGKITVSANQIKVNEGLEPSVERMIEDLIQNIEWSDDDEIRALWKKTFA